MKKVTDAFVELATQTTYDTIPADVIHETKRAFLDSLGCALGGISSDKGKIGVSMARRMGGVPEATLIGVGGKYSAAVAAFANSELLNGLDMDAIAHIPPIVFPSVLAVAESQESSGKAFLVAATVGQEIAKRLSRVLLSIMGKSLVKTGTTPDVFGNSNEHIIGAAVGNAMLMGLKPERIAASIGISAYLCSLPVCKDWESTMPKSMIKYSPVSWLAQGAVQAAMLAQEGYTGNNYTLDSEYGFPKIYCREEGIWNPEKVLEDISTKWFFTDYHYKPYPCCRFLHSTLDCFYKLKGKYGFSPEEITAVRCNTSAFVAHPDQYAVENQIDAQFSGPYCVALAEYGYKVGPSWQDKSALTDPKVKGFMKKVKMVIDPKYGECRKKDPRTWYARVEVDARGETYTEETEYSWGTNMEGYRLTDKEIEGKFRVNAASILTEEKMSKVIDCVMNLEKLNNISELTVHLAL